MTDIVSWLLSAESCSKNEREAIEDAVQSWRDYADNLTNITRLLDALARESSSSPTQAP